MWRSRKVCADGMQQGGGAAPPAREDWEGFPFERPVSEVRETKGWYSA